MSHEDIKKLSDAYLSIYKTDEKVVSEETEEQLNERVRGISVDREFSKMSSMSSDIKAEWRNVRRAVKKGLGVSDRELQIVGDGIEDAIEDLNKAILAAQDKIASLDK